MTAALSDEYLFDLIKGSGATIGKPGIPAFGVHLSDEQIREVIRYVRTLPQRQVRPLARTAATHRLTWRLSTLPSQSDFQTARPSDALTPLPPQTNLTAPI